MASSRRERAQRPAARRGAAVADRGRCARHRREGDQTVRRQRRAQRLPATSTACAVPHARAAACAARAQFAGEGLETGAGSAPERLPHRNTSPPSAGGVEIQAAGERRRPAVGAERERSRHWSPAPPPRLWWRAVAASAGMKLAPGPAAAPSRRPLKESGAGRAARPLPPGDARRGSAGLAMSPPSSRLDIVEQDHPRGVSAPRSHDLMPFAPHPQPSMRATASRTARAADWARHPPAAAQGSARSWPTPTRSLRRKGQPPTPGPAPPKQGGSAGGAFLGEAA